MNEVKAQKMEWVAKEIDEAARDGFNLALDEAAKVLEGLRSEKRQCADGNTLHDDRWCPECEAMQDAYAYGEDKIRALKK